MFLQNQKEFVTWCKRGNLKKVQENIRTYHPFSTGNGALILAMHFKKARNVVEYLLEQENVLDEMRRSLFYTKECSFVAVLNTANTFSPTIIPGIIRNLRLDLGHLDYLLEHYTQNHILQDIKPFVRCIHELIDSKRYLIQNLGEDVTGHTMEFL